MIDPAKIYVADLETNGLLPDLHTIHSLCFKHLGPDAVPHSYTDAGYLEHGPEKYGKLVDGLDYLAGLPADHIILWHNGTGFDEIAIDMLHPGWRTKAKQLDTLILSKLVFSDMTDRDWRNIRRKRLVVKKEERAGLPPEQTFPGHLIGRHSLEAWGYRLQEWKGDYSDEMKAQGLDPWETWNEAMQHYCLQDIEVTAGVWRSCWKNGGYDMRAFELECQFAREMRTQERNGFKANRAAMQELYATLSAERAECKARLQAAIEPWYRRVRTITPSKTLQYKDPLRPDRTEGATFTEVALTEFNPGSQLHIADRLTNLYGWEPDVFTDKGRPSTKEVDLEHLSYPIMEDLLRYLMLNKRCSQVSEGDEGWLRRVTPEGRIHGKVNTLGTGTRRCSHTHPNMAQVVAVGKPFGAESRSCFTADDGYLLVGCDLSGLELRMLAHYTYPYDGGKYGKLILEGDIHSANQQAAGLETRNQAKTFIYALLYGAGDAKIGAIAGKGPAKGRALKKQFFAAMPAMAELTKAVQEKAKKVGSLKLVDGGHIHLRSPHSALNFLLQGSGAVVCKMTFVLLAQAMRAKGWDLTRGGEAYAVAQIHDESQACVRPELLEEYEAMCHAAVKEAGERLGIKIPLACEVKAGRNWKETH